MWRNRARLAESRRRELAAGRQNLKEEIAGERSAIRAREQAAAGDGIKRKRSRAQARDLLRNGDL
jgi:hypothetical protein